MKITLYMATSIDGFITKGNNDSDWVSETDYKEFYKFIEDSDAVIMGKNTYDQFKKEDLPVGGKLNIVLSHNKEIAQEKIIVVSSADEVVEYAKKNQLKNLLLIGGSKTNKQFFEENLIDQVILSVHPLIIGDGLKLFGDTEISKEIKFIGSKVIDDELVQIKYSVQQ